MKNNKALLGTSLIGFALAMVWLPPANAQFTIRSLEEEKQLGATEHPKVVEEFGGAYTEGNYAGYFASIAGRLAANSDNPQVGYTFTLLNSPVLNAFALPGGYVYITRMIGVLANDEAEVAGVIGHEIGHVTARHGAQRETRGIFAGLGSVIAGVGGALFGLPELGQLGQVVGAAYLSKYSRDQEFEADTLGVHVLNRTGYDPYGMADFLHSLGAYGDFEAKKSGSQPRTAGLFDSHPRTPDRVVQAIQNAGGYARAPGSGYRAQEDYLRRIDGILYGDDPKQGLVRGRTFLHPELRITFTVPEGFTLTNTEAAVIAQSPQGGAMKFDIETDKRKAQSDPLSYITRVWTNDGQTRNAEKITINGFPAATATRKAQTKDGTPVDARLIAIQAAPGTLYRFLFITPTRVTKQLDNAFRTTAYSFRGLSEQEARSIRPYRIRVVQATASEGDLARRMPDDGFQLEHFRVLNGIRQDRPLRPGQLVKIVAE